MTDNNDDYECPVGGCDFTSHSPTGRSTHLFHEHSDDVTRETLLDDLRRVRDELGETPTYSEMNDHGEFSPNTFHRHFGSWNDAVEEAKRPTMTDNNDIFDNQDDGGWIVRDTDPRCTRCDGDVRDEIADEMDEPVCVDCANDIMQGIVDALKPLFDIANDVAPDDRGDLGVPDDPEEIEWGGDHPPVDWRCNECGFRLGHRATDDPGLCPCCGKDDWKIVEA